MLQHFEIFLAENNSCIAMCMRSHGRQGLRHMGASRGHTALWVLIVVQVVHTSTRKVLIIVLDHSQSLFYFVPRDSHSQAG